MQKILRSTRTLIGVGVVALAVVIGGIVHIATASQPKPVAQQFRPGQEISLAAASAYTGKLVFCWYQYSPHVPTVWIYPYTCPARDHEAIVNGTGPQGSPGTAGTNGTNGTNGAQGPQGPQGPAGKNAQALPYGIGQVLIDRGAGAAVWQTLSTTLGSPAGDTASGTFRFTCKTSTCLISARAYATANGYVAYPRLLIYSQVSSSNLQEQYCEYADGVNNEAGAETGFSGVLSTTPTAVTLGIGGTADCGISIGSYPSSVTVTSDGGNVVSAIAVPASNYYDVQVTWTFAKAA